MLDEFIPWLPLEASEEPDPSVSAELERFMGVSGEEAEGGRGEVVSVENS